MIKNQHLNLLFHLYNLQLMKELCYGISGVSRRYFEESKIFFILSRYFLLCY
jgi:hypothetical protein